MLTRMSGAGLAGSWALVTLGLLVVTGCSSSSGSRGGGCCRGKNPDGGPPLVTSAGATAATPNPSQPGLPPAGSAVTASPGTAPAGSEARPYGGQKTCPVMGEELGSMGPPIPVTVNGQTIYVCCKGCASKVQRDPDTYLRKVEAERAGQ